jgi:hypothetical protein
MDAEMIDALVVAFGNMTPTNCHLEKMKRILNKVRSFEYQVFNSNLIMGKTSDTYTCNENISQHNGFRWRVILVTYSYMCLDKDGNIRDCYNTFTFLQYLFDGGFYKLQDLYLTERETLDYLDNPSDILYAMPSCSESSIITGFIYSSKNLKKRRYEGVMEDLVKKGLEDFRYGDEGGLDDVL